MKNLSCIIRSIIRDIFAAMAEDWTECASTSAKMQTMTEKAILSHRISKYTIVAYTMCVLLFGAGNALTEKSVDSEEIVGEKPLIVKMYLPFKYDVSPLYEIILITQFFMQYVFAVLVGMLNIFIIMLVSWFHPEDRCIWKAKLNFSYCSTVFSCTHTLLHWILSDLFIEN